ncbi:MAG TPA: hypothetical protein PLU73_04865 [Bacteroidia bacterium]|nr:hypothetical protein [Bacteroidia bacterium]
MDHLKPSQKPTQRFTSPTILATLLLIFVFLLDISLPLGVAVGVLYLFCFFLVSRQSKKVILIFAIITSLLTITKFIIFFSPSITYMAIAKRALTIIVIVIVAFLAYRHRTLIDKINDERFAYIKELEKMLFMTSHEVRKPITTCLGLMKVVETDMPLSNIELKKLIHHLKSSALELDAFTRKLTNFISDIEQRNKNVS